MKIPVVVTKTEAAFDVTTRVELFFGYNAIIVFKLPYLTSSVYIFKFEFESDLVYGLFCAILLTFLED